MEKVRKGVAGLLSVMILAGAIPGAAWAQETQDDSRTLQAQEVETESRLNADSAPVHDSEVTTYDPQDLVTIMVQMDAPAVMDYYSVSTYAAQGEDASAGEAVSQFLASDDAQTAAQQLLDDQQGVLDGIQALAQSQETVALMALSEEAEDAAGTVVGRWSTAVNAVAIKMPYGMLEDIRALEGVKNAYVQHVYDQPDPITVEEGKAWHEYSYDKVNLGQVWADGYTGQGMLVAVLDTGLDLTWGYTYEGDAETMGITRVHEAFTDSSFKNDPADWELRYTSDSLAAFLEDNQLNANTGANGEHITYEYNALYKNLKVPYAADYNDGDMNVFNTNDHGTHVSGTVTGYAETAEGEVLFSGIAPDAQLLSMKVFPDGEGGAPEYAVVSALEDALKLGADMINISLGSDNGFADDDTLTNAAYKVVEEAGIVCMTSAGNSGYSSTSNNYGEGPLTDNVDTSMMSSPGIYASNLSVASLENAIQVVSYLEWGDREVSYTDPWTVAMKATFADGSEYPVYLVEGTGTWSDYNAVGWYNEYSNPTGKTGFALVKRGELSFEDKVKNGESFHTITRDGTVKGVLGVLVYDSDPNATELLNMSVENTTISSAFIGGQDGAAMEAELKAGHEVKITVPEQDKAVENPTDGEMSVFSSWGAGPGLELKPEITAPGGNIWSAIVDQVNTGTQGYTGSYGMMSGTSMAAPHMTGIGALVRQYVQSNSAFADLTAAQVGDLVSQLLVSTAVPQVDLNGVYYSPRQQGAGLVNAGAAVETPAYITVDGQTVGKLELKDDPDRTGSYDIAFDVHNFSGADVTYNVSITLMRPDTATVDSAWGERETMEHQDVVIKTVDLGQVTVKGGETAAFSKTVTLSDEEKAQLNELFENGVYVEGYVTLTAEGVPTLGLPMLAYYGDWTAAPIFDEGSWLDEAADGENVFNNEATWGVSLLGSTMINWSTGELLGYLNLGQNIFDPESVMNQNTFHPENITISPNGDEYFDRVDDYILYQLRDAKLITLKVTDDETGEVYFNSGTAYIPRTTFNASVGVPYPYSAYGYGIIPTWDGTDMEGNPLPTGTQCTFTITAYGEGDYGDKVYNEEAGYEVTNFDGVINGTVTPTFNGHAMDMTGDTITFPVTIDTVAPKLENNAVTIYEKDGRTYLTGTVYDEDGSLASLEVVPYVTRTYKEGMGDPNQVDVGLDRSNPFLVENYYEPALKTRVFTADVTEYFHTNESYEGENNYYDFVWNGNVLISCGDYGANDRSYAVTVDSTPGLVLSQTSALMHPGDAFELSVIDNTGEDAPITRTSSNPAVATIDEMGLITAVAPGQTVITVSNGISSATCVVAVEEIPTEVEDFDLSISHFDGMKPEAQLVVKVDNLQPANVELNEITWKVYEENYEDYAEGLVNITQYSSDGLAGGIYLNVGTSEELLPAGNGYLEVTLNGVTRTMTFAWEDLYQSETEDDLVSGTGMGDQIEYVQQGESVDLLAMYRQSTLHEVNDVDASDLVGLQLDGPGFYSVGGTYDATLVNEEGYALPQEIHLYTRYSDGSEVELVNYDWYTVYTYDAATGALHVNYAPSGSDNVLVIRAEGVESAGAPAGEMSGTTWERPDALYGPFDWEVVDGTGTLEMVTTTVAGRSVEAARYTPAEPGVSTITATSKDGKYSLTFAVVSEAVLADSLDLNSHRVDLEAGETFQLTGILTPEPTLAEDTGLVYTSFDPTVATVDENGVITAHKEGYAYLKVSTAADNRVSSYCVVHVTGNLYQVKFMDGDQLYKVLEVPEGSSVGKPQDPVREGYTFDGWFVDEAGTQAYDFATPVSADLVLYAHWTQVEDTDPTPTPTPGGNDGSGNQGGNTKPDGSNPETGDESNLILPMATLVCAMAGAVALTVVRRKEED